MDKLRSVTRWMVRLENLVFLSPPPHSLFSTSLSSFFPLPAHHLHPSSPPSSSSEGVLYGPLHNEAAVQRFESAIAEVKTQGGNIVYGGKVITLLLLKSRHREAILCMVER